MNFFFNNIEYKKVGSDVAKRIEQARKKKYIKD